jgi:hypothetical protein
MKKHYHPETPLKAKLTETLRKVFPRFIILRIENNASNAIPDIVATGNRITSWIEVKYADPDFRSKGDQELMMSRLGRQGYALYVVFYEVGESRRTFIVDPTEIGKPIETWGNSMPGFDYYWVASQVGKIHGNHTV